MKPLAVKDAPLERKTMKLKQLFCRHSIWQDFTTSFNKRAGVKHFKCFRCEKMVTIWKVEK